MAGARVGRGWPGLPCRRVVLSDRRRPVTVIGYVRYNKIWYTILCTLVPMPGALVGPLGADAVRTADCGCLQCGVSTRGARALVSFGRLPWLTEGREGEGARRGSGP